MNEQGTKIVVMTTIMVLVVASSAVLIITAPNNGNALTTSGVTSIYILGNSSDIIYPELMEATFEEVEPGGWTVTANFVDNSEGWETPEIYDKTFSVTGEEVTSISDAVSIGLNLTSPCEDNKEAILLSNAHIGFEILITYEDGTWLYIWTLQTESGHILFNSGTGTPNQNMLDAELLQPVSAFDELIDTIETVFSNNITE